MAAMNVMNELNEANWTKQRPAMDEHGFAIVARQIYSFLLLMRLDSTAIWKWICI